MEGCLDAIAPIKRVTIANHKLWKEAWLSKGLTKSMDKCLYLYKKTITTDAKDEDVKKYKSYRNCLTKIKRKACTEYYIKQCYNLKSNMKKLWNLINKIIGKSNDKTSIINHITVENVCYYDAKDVANKFSEFYSTVGANLAQNINKNETNIIKFLNKINKNDKMMYLDPITPTEIKQLINKLPAKDSSVYDNISNNLLKHIKESVIKPLTYILNLSLSRGVFPENMKLAEIIPLYKKGARNEVSNYRPISLLITMSKLLEKCMYKRLYKFLSKNDIFYKKQYGFCSNHSCEQAIQDLYGHILLAKEEGFKTIAIFLDLSNAFDTFSHELLLKKLEIYGIRNLSHKWFDSYISNRQLQIKCKTLSSNMFETSSKYQITYGTTQGSCLRPLLFNIFCNDLYLNINNCNLIMFAGDTTLYASHRNSQYLIYLIQEDLRNISE